MKAAKVKRGLLSDKCMGRIWRRTHFASNNDPSICAEWWVKGPKGLQRTEMEDNTATNKINNYKAPEYERQKSTKRKIPATYVDEIWATKYMVVQWNRRKLVEQSWAKTIWQVTKKRWVWEQPVNDEELATCKERAPSMGKWTKRTKRWQLIRYNEDKATERETNTWPQAKRNDHIAKNVSEKMVFPNGSFQDKENSHEQINHGYHCRKK